MRVELPQNLDNVEASGQFELLPPGTYSFEVDNIEMKTSKQSKPYLNMTYKVVDDEEYAGRKIFDMITLAPDALFRLKQFSLATGIKISEEFDTEDFLHVPFQAVLDVEKGKEIPGQEGEFYPDKNRIKSFVFTEEK